MGTLTILWQEQQRILKPEGLEVKTRFLGKSWGRVLSYYGVIAVNHLMAKKLSMNVEVHMAAVNPLSAHLAVRHLDRQLEINASDSESQVYKKQAEEAMDEKAKAATKVAETRDTKGPGNTSQGTQGNDYRLDKFPDFYERFCQLALRGVTYDLSGKQIGVAQVLRNKIEVGTKSEPRKRDLASFVLELMSGGSTKGRLSNFALGIYVPSQNQTEEVVNPDKALVVARSDDL